MSVWVPWHDPVLEEAVGAKRGPVLVYTPDGGPPGPLGEVEFWALPHPTGSKALELFGHMPRLAVVQVLSSGVDHVAPHIPSSVALCSAPQLRTTSTAETAMCLILGSLNRMNEWYEMGREGRWRWLNPRPGLFGRTVLLVGYGNVGQALHGMLKGFDVKVVPVARNARDGVDGAERLLGLLPSADVVVLAVPLTDETRELVNAQFLDRMRRMALLVNVGRGELVDMAALLSALDKGRVMAALDVVHPEPLPRDHPLWSSPNVLISPHTGGNPEGLRAAATATLAQQLGRFARGEPLAHIAGEEVRRSNTNRRNSP